MKIAGDVFVVPGVVADPYILVDADGPTVIDAGLLDEILKDGQTLPALGGLRVVATPGPI